MSRTIRASRELYRVLVKLYPAPLQRHFAAEMVDVFEEQLAEAWTETGVLGLIRVWSYVIAERRCLEGRGRSGSFRLW